MEAIKQAADSGVAVFLVILIGLALLLIILAVMLESSKNITTDEAFEVKSDLSSYTCIISEVDNDLSLNCLKIK